VDALPPYIKVSKAGVLVEVYVAPRAKRSQVTALHGGYPKIALAAPPIEGRANEELISFLRDLFGLPRSRIELVRGDTSKRKLLLLKGISVQEARKRLENPQKSA
jgi:uncharacterized protein (TIGR00251 family)